VTVRDLPVDFNSFVVSLASSAMLHLGEARDPRTGASSERDIPLAKNVIDALVMLREKTQGNLDEDEARLLGAVIDELQTKLTALGG
jgi:hypothetical protein